MLIFDLDQTLVDTRSVESLRAARQWGKVMARIDRLAVYPGITELLRNLSDEGHALAIVTKSPDMVAKAFCELHGWPIEIVIGYHQVARRKPAPDGLLLAMKRGRVDPGETIHVGDAPEDTEAARAAGVMAVGAAWGAIDIGALRASAPDQIFETLGEFAEFLRGRA
jgi:HAD superfamily hydrolase (TIGR01662 family)